VLVNRRLAGLDDDSNEEKLDEQGGEGRHPDADNEEGAARHSDPSASDEL
jgi:hypothetical protein